MVPSGCPSDGGGRLGSGRVIAEGGGSPRCCVDILSLALALTRSEPTGELTLGLAETLAL